MGRRRRRRSPAEIKAGKKAQQKKWDSRSADDIENMLNDKSGKGNIGLYGYGGQGGQFKNEAEARKYMQDLRGKERGAAARSAIGDMVKQYTGQDLPPPPGQMPQQSGSQSPKGQMGAAAQAGKALAGAGRGPQQGAAPMSPKAGGAPKGQAQDPYQTGAPRGSYMDKVRRNRATRGMSGYGQYGPAQPMGRPNPYAGNYSAFPPPPPPRTRSYNPVTGLME